MVRTFIRWAAILLFPVIMLAGCGGGGDSENRYGEEDDNQEENEMKHAQPDTAAMHETPAEGGDEYY